MLTAAAHSIVRGRRLRVLELFCGTKSISKVCRMYETLFAEVMSVDIDPKCAPDICSDIMNIEFAKIWAPGQFDIVWASPPCTMYSVLRKTKDRQGDIEVANIVTQRTLDIIAYLQPKVWMIENPATGYMKNQPFMQCLPYNDVSYCKYGYPYRKQTRIWNNIVSWHGLVCHNDCGFMVIDKSSGCLNHQGTFGGLKQQSLKQKYSIPYPLVRDLLLSSHAQVTGGAYGSGRKQNTAGQVKMVQVQEPLKIRGVSAEDKEDVVTFTSLSDAAKFLDGQVTQVNKRALIKRHIMRAEPLAGRVWSMIEPENDVREDSDEGGVRETSTSTATSVCSIKAKVGIFEERVRAACCAATDIPANPSLYAEGTEALLLRLAVAYIEKCNPPADDPMLVQLINKSLRASA